MEQKTTILVTGSHRSGTTWVGKMIDLSSEIWYIHEPFNLDEPRINPVSHWFEYVHEDDPQKSEVFHQYLSDMMHLRLRGLMNQLKAVRGPRDLARFVCDIHGRLAKRPLIKDPLAVMSADWIANQFDADVICMIRHPAAFVASLKEKDWNHPFGDFVEQPALLEELSPFADQIIDYHKSPRPLLDEGILLWNIIYYRISQFKKDHPDWIFLKHEDVSMDPVSKFEKVYHRLGIKFNHKIRKEIIKSSTSEKTGRLTRDSKKNISTWKSRLAPIEIDKIKKGTEGIAKQYYSEKEW